MGLGIDLAREDAPIHADVLDNLKDQLLIALVHRLGDKVSIPVDEIDDTGKYTLSFCVTAQRTFEFECRKKS